MVAQCYCEPSVASSLCIHLLVYDEMRFYQTCKIAYTQSHERREWWQHVRQLDGLAFHTTPGMGQRSWNCFTVWRSFNIDLVTPSPNESISTESDSEHNSPSEDPDAERILDIVWTNPQLAGSGPTFGPLCEHCGMLFCAGRSETKGLICARCLQGECIDQMIGYWGNLHRNHGILSQPTLARNILEYMYGNGLSAYCYCGQCNPDWFLHGWVCCPYSGARAIVRPDRNNLAWRRSTRTPEWVIEESL